jgi:hypothetical protein
MAHHEQGVFRLLRNAWGGRATLARHLNTGIKLVKQTGTAACGAKSVWAWSASCAQHRVRGVMVVRHLRGHQRGCSQAGARSVARALAWACSSRGAQRAVAHVMIAHNFSGFPRMFVPNKVHTPSGCNNGRQLCLDLRGRAQAGARSSARGSISVIVLGGCAPRSASYQLGTAFMGRALMHCTVSCQCQESLNALTQSL